MGEEKKKLININPKTENIVKGLFICLLSIILVINVGKVARTLAFIPLYLFGGAYYFIFMFTFAYGVLRIILRRKPKVFKYHIVVGSLFFVFSMLFYIGVAQTPITEGSTMDSAVKAYNSNLANYYNLVTINAFDASSTYSSGILGVVLAYSVGNIAVVMAVGSLLLFTAILLYALPTLTNYFSKRKNTPKGPKPVKEKKEKKERKPLFSFLKKEPEKVVKEEPVETLKPIEEPIAAVKPGYETDRAPFVNEGSGFSKPSVSLDDAYGVSHRTIEHNEFTPLVFSRQRKPVEQPTQITAPSLEESAPVVEEEPVYEEENLIETRPEIIEPVQEEPVPQIDDSLVMAQPVFLNPEEEAVEETPAPIPTQIEAPKKRERVNWVPPSSDILTTYETQEAMELNEKVANERMEAINKVIANFKVGAHCTSFNIGPSITRYNIEYDENVSYKAFEKLVGDIAVRLGGISARFTPIVPNESYSGLEVPNATVTTVGFKEVFDDLPDVKKHPLAVAFGKDISGNVINADFNEFPHILVAGTTGSGKSIFVHSIISTLIMRVSPDDLKIVLVDPKKVEMTKYRDMPHLLCPIITEAEKAKVMLTKLVEEMNNRYEVFGRNGEVSDIKQYNEWARANEEEQMPYIIVVLDEYADLVETCKDLSQPVVLIAQKARACGIHLLISTQRPSTNVVTGVIKGNLPTHVALMTSSYIDSMTIIGEGGAEALLGKGDMLVQCPLITRQGVVRLQGCFVSNKEIIRIVAYLKEHYETHYDERFLDLVDHSKETAKDMIISGEVQKEADEAEEMKYQAIKEWVLTQKFVSMSKIQRECMVGFNRAGRFFKRLQQEGIVSFEVDGASKGCKVIGGYSDTDEESYPTSDELIG